MRQNLSQKNLNERFDNPIIKNQSTGNQFIENETGEIELIGEFVGADQFISLEQITTEIASANKKIILNIGDSSTSGWNSELVSINRDLMKTNSQNKKEIFPLFSYDTYSDVLRKKLSKNYYIINAGVPTHTSLNSFRRLKNVVNNFKDNNIKIDYVTVYVGNNDCACNANLEEKNRKSIPNIFFKLFFNNKIIPRTSIKDYKKNIKSIIDFCKEEKIKIILIKPIIPIYWEPGRRVERKKFVDWDEEDKNIEDIKNQLGGGVLFDSYKKAYKLWKAGIDEHKKGNIQGAIHNLEQAKELDFITPRIKNDYKKALKSVSEINKIPFIDIKIPKDKIDGKSGEKYFCDYCHPIKKANTIIAEEIINKLKVYGEKNVS